MTLMPSADSSSWPLLASSEETQGKIKSAKVLVVGAGGIGCELLKTLVLSGFRNIKVVDLDTIDTSNLNRQFLFRKKHVGQSKASVASAAVKAFCPAADIEAFCDNIKNPQFGREFFSQFDMVLNGLDNLEARRHVNRLCLAANKPLVESGTAGYLGQVSVHIPQRYECFECQPKPVPKSFPVCTIRNTPEKPIHCIVWAKELLFQRLFGKVDEVTDLDEESEAAEGEEQPEADTSDFLRKDGEAVKDYAARIFKRVFQLDVERVLGMDDLWKTGRTKPKPLILDELVSGDVHKDVADASAVTSASKLQGFGDVYKVWTVEENARIFLEAIRLYHDGRPDELGAAVFDKEDPLAVDFVTAASNLRSVIYNIPPQSSFDAKGMAGNIIHAIATTNAIISGLITAEAIKLVAGLPDMSRTTFLLAHPSNSKLLQPTKCSEPNPQCPVCSKARLHLAIDTKKTTFQDFISKVLKKHLSMIAPSVRTEGGLGYEEGDDLEEDEREEYRRLLPKALCDLPGGIRTDTVVEVDDFAQQFEVKIIVDHKEDWDEEANPDFFEVKGEIPPPGAADDDKDAAGTSTAGNKRPAEDSLDAGRGKKAKAEDDVALSTNQDEDDDDDVVLVEDGGAEEGNVDDDVVIVE